MGAEVAMGLLDVLQSASNAVAGNVAGPVDLLSFALRKAGIPIPEGALGSSEWMKRKGLMRDVPHGAEQVVGETLGLLAPTAIAANAPKIARGLLQAQANAAAPKTLHPETGAIVWHGSPHKFDRFDSSKMGTGEGAQAYGAGSYLAEAKGVGRQYADNVKDMGAVQRINAEMSRLAKIMSGDEVPGAYRKYRTDVGRKAAEQYDALMAQRDGVRTAPGYLYKVDLPDEFIPRMLDWDKPLSQQPKAVQDALGVKVRDFDAELALLEKAKKAGKPVTDFPEYKQLTGLLDASWRFNQDAGADLYRQFGKPLEAAQKLKDMGIPGIRYLDAASRPSPNIIDQRLLGLLQKHDGNAEAAVDAFMRGVYNTPKQKALMRADLLKQLSVKPTSNFVIFPGLEDQLKILERNGVGLLNP